MPIIQAQRRPVAEPADRRLDALPGIASNDRPLSRPEI